IGRFIHFYNYRRPHMSIAYKIPAVAHTEQGEQEKRWKNSFYTGKSDTDGKNIVTLPGQTASPEEGVNRCP
ncbi:IS3 family transposase, partial [Bacteroidaceae bacterium 14-104]|nr:IS3 family transposase [Phocaeicola oris]